jgi:hypothetical protein
MNIKPTQMLNTINKGRRTLFSYPFGELGADEGLDWPNGMYELEDDVDSSRVLEPELTLLSDL